MHDTPPNREGLFVRYMNLIAAGEPFRLLFPLGILIGIAGVSLWPLYAWHVTTVYPAVAHSRMMIEGFLTCFVVGFLGTALPRLLGSPRLSLGEAVGFAVSLATVALLHGFGWTVLGDQVFFLTLAALVFCLFVRFLFRKDTPPPAFVLVALGVLSALAGAAIQAVLQIAPADWPAWTPIFGRLLLNQGFLLLPIMGIGAFLLPRFFGLPNRQDFLEAQGLPPGWMTSAAFAAMCGIAVLASFAIEAAGIPRWGCFLRAFAVLLYFFNQVPLHRAGFGGGTLALGLRIALFSIPAGYLSVALWPQLNVSLLHIVFVTGFSLLTLIVASRVILGHSGQSEKFRSPLRPVLAMVLLVTLAMLTRVSADLMPSLRLSHYAYAALAWIAGVVVWIAFVLPGVTIADSESN